MTPSKHDLVPLRRASLCLDCETITAAHTNCLACGSQALLNIARALSHQRTPGFVSSETTRGLRVAARPMHYSESFARVDSNLHAGLGRRNSGGATFGVTPSGNCA